MIKRLKQFAGRIYNSAFVRAAVGIFSTKIASMVIGLVTSVITARGLGPAGKGLVATVNSIYGTGAQFANLGLHSANTYNIARDREAIKPAFADSFWLCVVTGGICVVIFCVALPQGGLIGLGPGLTAIALLMVPLSLMLIFAENLLLAAGDISGFNRASLGQSLMQFVFILVLFGCGVLVPETSAFCTFLTAMTMTGFCILHIKKITGALSFQFNILYLKRSAKYSFFSYSSCFFSYLLLRADVMITKMYLTDAAVGQYSLAVNMSDMIGMINDSISALLVPKLAAIKDPIERKATFVRIFCGSGLLIAGVSGIIVIFAKPVVFLLYGRAYEPSILPLRLLAVANIFRFGFSFLFQYLVSCDVIQKTVLPVIAGTTINFFLNALLIQKLEIAGVSFASLIAYAAVLILVLPAVRKEIKNC